jgi:hypothetical protein
VCCDFAAHPRSRSLTHHLAALRAARPALERTAARRLLDFYRRRRRLPSGPVAALVSRRTRARIVARGEIEHALGIAGLIPRLRADTHRLAARLRGRWGT